MGKEASAHSVIGLPVLVPSGRRGYVLQTLAITRKRYFLYVGF